MGSSVDLGRRFRHYYNVNRLLSRPDSDRPITRSLLKYRYSNFRLDILEYCNPDVLIKREQYYIDLLKPEFQYENYTDLALT